MNRLVVLATLLSLACATSSSSEHLPFIPNPAAVVQPKETAESVIKATPGASIAFANDSMIVRSRIEGLTTQMVAYAAIKKVELFSQTNDGVKVFGVLLTDKNLRTLFLWSTQTKDDAQKLADAISVLAASSVATKPN